MVQHAPKRVAGIVTLDGFFNRLADGNAEASGSIRLF